MILATPFSIAMVCTQAIVIGKYRVADFALHDQSAKALSTNNFCPSGFAVQSSQPTNVYLWTVIFQNFLLSKFYTIWY